MELKINQPKIRSIKPEILVYNKDGNFVDVSTYFISGTIENSIESEIGTASLQFAPVNSNGMNISIHQIIHYLKRILKKYSPISIKVDKNSDEYDFFGVINHLSESITTDSTGTGRMLTVNCTLALPAMLMRDSLPNSPILQSSPKIAEEYGQARANFFTWLRDPKGEAFFKSNIKDTILWILENTSSITEFKKFIDFDPNSYNFLGKLTDYVTGKSVLEIETLSNDLLFDPNLSTYTGTILEYIKACIDPDFYELFFETATAGTGSQKFPTNKLVIRTKPYTCKKADEGTKYADFNWQYAEDLPTIIFDSSYKVSEDLGVNDFDIKNYFYTAHRVSLLLDINTSSGLIGASFPVIDIPSTKKYGFREMVTETRLIDSTTMGIIYKDGKLQPIKNDTDLPDDFRDGLMKKRDRIVEWYNYPNFESGQITVIGNSIYKIGRKLKYVDKQFYDEFTDTVKTGMEYYITGVSRQFSAGGEDRATLRLVRGLPIEQDFLYNWNKSNEKNLFKVEISKDDKPAISETNKIIFSNLASNVG